MTEQHSHINITENISQESHLLLGNSKAVNPPEKPTNIFGILPDGTILEDAEDETPEESIANSLRDIVNSLHGIDESIGYLCDIKERELQAYTERTEVIEEYNRFHREEEPPEDTTQGSYPPKPPPSSQDGRKSKTTDDDESLAVKRLREAEQVGE